MYPICFPEFTSRRHYDARSRTTSLCLVVPIEDGSRLFIEINQTTGAYTVLSERDATESTSQIQLAEDDD